MPDVHLLQCLHRIVSEADVKIDYVLLGHPEHREMYENETKRVVDLFISMQLYDSARAFAKLISLPIMSPLIRYGYIQVRMR